MCSGCRCIDQTGWTVVGGLDGLDGLDCGSTGLESGDNLPWS